MASGYLGSQPVLSFEELLLTSHSVHTVIDNTDTGLPTQLVDGHIYGQMPIDWTIFSIGFYISHMDTHTALAVAHRKHMVKLIGLTWQPPQWCQSNPSLKPWWHHHTRKSLWEPRPHVYG